VLRTRLLIVHILTVSNTYPPADISGVGSLVFELAHLFGEQEPAEHRVSVLTRVVPPDDPYAIGVGGAKILFPLYAGWRFLKLAGSTPYDVVHLHESDGVMVAVVHRLARIFGLRAGRSKLAVTLHVSYVRERLSVRPIRADGKIVSRPTGSERVFAWLRAPLLSFLGKLTARLCDGIATVSKVTAGEIEADYRVPVDAAIPNGVSRWIARDDAQVPVRDEGVDGEAEREGWPAVLFVGRLRTRKAAAVLLEAFAILLKDWPQAQLILAGSGEHHEALQQHAETLGIAPSTRFLGAVPRAEMDRWYQVADVFCLPSIYEGFPVTILEAMAAGLPVVSTTVSGIPEAIEDGVSGYLVEPESATGLAEALARLAADRELTRSMGRNARRAVREQFSIEATGAAYLELWQKLVAR
ncbi:MAG: glycosyltransferase family 4 protein, partial [Acidobacteriota bacterium]